MIVPSAEPIFVWYFITPFSTSKKFPSIDSFVFVVIFRLDTAAIEDNASPLKPNVFILNKSSVNSILDVACL